MPNRAVRIRSDGTKEDVIVSQRYGTRIRAKSLKTGEITILREYLPGMVIQKKGKSDFMGDFTKKRKDSGSLPKRRDSLR